VQECSEVAVSDSSIVAGVERPTGIEGIGVTDNTSIDIDV